jgi:6-pyruvoyltetrahydropterin/6-carboxytetrahydropterin synthase
MHSVGVRDHLLVAHSLAGDASGSAPRLHEVTYTVSVEIERAELGPDGILCDLGSLRAELRAVLDGLDHQNLDEHPAFPGRRSTTELIARYIHRQLGPRLPFIAGVMLTITLDESPAAWARYRAPVGPTIALPTRMARL